jgi:tetratricopeptide (TPR) repeat protein
MAPFDRESALKTAEKALRLGRIDAAIAEYVRIVEAQPRDWNSANALGDLYVRANKIDQGVTLYGRIAEHLAREGFYPKAAALYKKILKIKPGDEQALLQSGDIAAQQGLLADAKNAFKAVADKRRGRGDTKGAAEVDIRLGKLDPDDIDSRLAAAQAAAQIGDVAMALAEFREVADKYQKQGNTAGSLEVLTQIAALAPDDLEVRTSLAQGYAATGALDRARKYLDARTAGDNASLWLTLAEIELSAAKLEPGRAAVAKAITLQPTMRAAAVALGCRLAAKSGDAGYQCVDAVVEAAVRADAFADAAAALHEFVAVVRHHLIALMRLVEICVDGGLDTTMYEAQALLADAYLEVGRGLEARIIGEDLVAREPWNTANIERFRRALVMLGEADPDAVIADRLSGESPFLATDNLDLNEGVFFEEPGSPASADPAAKAGAEPAPAAAPKGRTGTKAKDAAATAQSATAVVIEAGQPSEAAVIAPRSLEQVFRDIREDAAQAPDEEAAAEQLTLATTYYDLGMVDDAIEAAKEAARSPRQRFEGAALLGRLHRERGELAGAIQWFEQAAEAPPTSPAAGHGLLYDLAETLESAGEIRRALAVFVELEAESRGFRDVTERIERLSTIPARG